MQEREQFYVVAARYKDGQWNKLSKALDLPGINAIPFFWDKEKAIYFLNNSVDKRLREFYSVFQLNIEITNAEKQ